MANQLIGRKQEREILQEALESNEAELVSVIGRRRVGKTYLVESFYKDQIIFELTGSQKGTNAAQLDNFTNELSILVDTTLPIKPPSNWRDAFQLLRTHLEPNLGKEKKVIFFDELPWLDRRRSGFLSAFSYWWNRWASRKNIIVVICGSAASWMIRKVVNDKGGLHNRITKRIHVRPFTLSETEQYLESRNLHFDRYEIVQLYMTMGGVPHYLKEIKRSKSVIQNIDKICFSDNGLLKDEFSNLYSSLFENAEKHIAVIRALSTKRLGLTRTEIIQLAKISAGGGATKVLEELIQSGFISAYHPFGNKKSKRLFRLTDEYSLFYLQFMENKLHEGAGTWQHLSQTQSYKTWSGYAFENICLKHISQIKKALGIAGVYALSSTFYKRGTKNEKGIQIDLVLNRNDNVINLFEIKFYNEAFSIDKEYASRLREKRGIFREITKTKKHLSWTAITSFGLKKNQYSLGIVETELTMDDLF